MGFDTFKVKLHQVEACKKLLALHDRYPRIKWRLDFNMQTRVQAWPEFKNILKNLKEQLEFIEDPFQDPENYQGADQNMFARDWLNLPKSPTKIVKPSRDSLQDISKELQEGRTKHVVFTHSQETCLGQSASAYWAASFYKKYPNLKITCGLKCFSLEDQELHPLEEIAPSFDPPKGAGLGFGEILDKQAWKRLL